MCDIQSHAIKQPQSERLRQIITVFIAGGDESMGRRINLTSIWYLHPHTYCGMKFYFIIVENNEEESESSFADLIQSKIKWAVLTVVPN